MNKQKRDIEYVNNVSTKLTINLIFELKCNNLDFESKFKKVIPKIASPQAKTSQNQTRSVEKVKFEGDRSAPLTSEDDFQISEEVNIGLRRATYLISKKEALNVHFQGSKFELFILVLLLTAAC